MDKLEQYLDQVCRGIAGPRSLRQHIRLELREHIRDAVAEREAGGMLPEEALARALEDFGGPEQVRAELEATHGHRLMTVVVDKAMQWKEKTMKAKWIWTTWAHVMLLLAISLEVCFIYGCLIFIYPKYRELQHDRWIDTLAEGGIGPLNRWASSVLIDTRAVCEWGLWILGAFILLWVLFEWRVRSENKTYMRLAALGTVAVKLLVPAFLTAAALILSLIISIHPYQHQDLAKQIASQASGQLEASVPALEEAVAGKDWYKIQLASRRALGDLSLLESTGAGLPLPWEVDADSGAAHLKAASSAMQAVNVASQNHDQAAFDAAMKSFHEAYAHLHGKSS